ncbi:unnamed protein product [Scytosiphon promiscuus]
MPMGSCSGPLDLHRAAFVPPGYCAPSFPATHKRCRQERHQQQQQQQQGATSRHARSINHGMILLLRHDAAASRRQGSCVTLCDGVLASCNGEAGGGGADGSARERQHDKLFMSLAQKMAPAERDSAAEAAEATGAAARPADFLLNSRQYRRRVVTVPPLQSEEQQQQQQQPQWQLQQQQGYERSSSSSSSHSNHQHILAAASEPDQERRPSGGGVKRVSSGAGAPAAKINGDGGRSASASNVSGGVGGSTSSEGGGSGSNRGVDRMPEEEEEEAEFQTFGSASSSGRARRQRLRRQRERATMAAKKSLVKKVKVLGDTGQWRQAISEMDSAVDGGLPPDEYVYGSGVGAAASSGRWREALGVLRRMQEDGGMAPTTAVYNAAIKACARAGKAELAVALLEEMRTNATKADDAARTAAADTVGETATDAAGAGGASAAEGSTMESTRRIGGTVSGAVLNGGRKGRAKEEVYSASRLNGAGRGREDEVAERSMGKDTAGVKRGRRRPMSGAAGSSSPSGCDPDIQTINTVMSACAKAGNWALALEVMDKGRRLDGLHPNRVTYNTAISACGRGGESDRAVRLLRDMRLDGLAPNAISYNSAIAACSVNGQWRRALSLLAEMEAATTAGAGDRGRGDKGRAAGPPPDRYSFSSAIAACGRGGQWSLAVGLLSAMRRKGIAPGVVAFNAAISACGAAGQWERAVGLLRDMEAEAGEKKDGDARGGGGAGSGFSGPDRVSFNAAINACSNAGEWQQAVSLLEEMRRNAKGDAGGESAVLADAEKLDTEARTAGSGARDVPRGLAGEPQRQQSKDSGVLPSSENRGVDGVRRNGEGMSSAAAVPLGAGASKADRRRQRRRRGKESRPGGPTPDVVTYSTAITACSRAGNWERALQLLEQMQGEDGLSPNSATFTTMIAAWRKDWGYGGEDAGGQEARGSLLPLLDSVAACGVKPDRRLYGSALDACADASLCERARTLLNEMVASGMEAEDRDLSAVKLACAARQRPPPPPPLSPPTPSDAGDEG